MTTKDVLALALEALEALHYDKGTINQQNALAIEAITAIKQAQGNSDSTCNETLRLQGKAYPRTCKKCRLGPCIGKPVEQAQQAQEPVAWVWNPAKESWEQVRAFGHWQQGAIYAFGPNPPAPKQAEPHVELLQMLARRARNFPNYPMGYHLPEVFAAVGEQPPTPPEAKA